MKRIVALVTFFFLLSFTSKASNLERIDTLVEIDNDGTAYITQIWDTYNTDGTEWYIPIDNLNHMELENFQVKSLTNDKPFNKVNKWKVKDGFNEKAFKYGINKKSRKNFEMCWGKSEMGHQVYEVKWTYKNAVQSFPDLDGLLIKFVNDKMEPYPNIVTVKVQLKDGRKLDQSNSGIWGFGYDGLITFQEDGSVLSETNNFNYNSHMTILVGIDKGLIIPTYQGKGTFEKLKNKAFKGSDYTNKRPKSIKDILLLSITPLMVLLAYLTTNNGKGMRGWKIVSKSKINYKEPPYYREKLLDTYIPAVAMMSVQKSPPKGGMSNIISAYFLKWIKEGYLKNTTKIVSGNMDEDINMLEIVNIDLQSEDEAEQLLFKMVRGAAGYNKLLEPKELEEYFKDGSEEYEDFEDKAYESALDYLENNLLVEIQPIMFLGLNATVNGKSNRVVFTEEGQRECANAYAMRRFFKDFTLINERGIKEVNLWGDYLLTATVMGMGEKVMKAMKDLVPSYQVVTGVDNDSLLTLTRTMSTSSIRGYSRGSSRSSRSGGGGGRSSSGGGGGSSGGGSGGGSR